MLRNADRFGYADAIGDMACTAGGSAVGGLWLVACADLVASAEAG